MIGLDSAAVDRVCPRRATPARRAGEQQSLTQGTSGWGALGTTTAAGENADRVSRVESSRRDLSAEITHQTTECSLQQ